MRIWIALAAAMLAQPAAARPGAVEARAFLDALYAPFAREPLQPTPVLTRPALFFEPALARAMIADSDASAKRGEVGVLDGDPICDCQDYVPFKAAISRIVVTKGKIHATVNFNNARPVSLRYILVSTPEGLRIHDIVARGEGLRGLYGLKK